MTQSIAHASIIKTADNLRTIAQLSRLSVPEVKRLTLPELEAVVEQVARLVPAGNVPGMILSGLARLPERRPPPKMIRRDLNLLFKGVEQTLDKAVYTTFFAGPAAVIGAYQRLLKLAGKDPAEAFPEGTWQFYVEYAMREDTARHANETHGFDSFLRRHELHLSAVDRITAWVMSAIYILHQYDALLANEWRERVYTQLLAKVTQNQTDAAHYAQLYTQWERQRPYGRNPDGLTRQTYSVYRRHHFDQFLAEALYDLDDDQRSKWQERVQKAEADELPAYQQQMSILASLDPGPYGETRVPIPLAKACIGLIHQGCYYLILACLPGSDRPADVQAVRDMVATILAQTDPANQPSPAPPLAQVKRAAWPELRLKLDQGLVQELDRLRFAPILINCDQRPRHLPLAELRQAERGLGDHALTLFDTSETMVFDQSHIFFDGAWGAALAEIMTQEALYWAKHLHVSAVDPAPVSHQRPQVLAFNFRAADLALIQQAPRVAVEVSAETDAVELKAMLSLRRLFKQRSDLLQLTINDLLILYRAIHALTYQPDPALTHELEEMLEQTTLAGLEALNSASQGNPTIVIPIDASQRTPRDRLYPITFEAPLSQLDFLGLQQQVMAAWDVYQQAKGDRSEAYTEFDRLQREYLATLAGFGQLLSRTKQIARDGESLSVGAIKLLAHFPAPLQHLLEKIPERFDLLNDLLAGREVFSNIGAVAPTSTLTRFISAKDDNDKKTLIWGVITDAHGVMRITLRDFRPHVALLVACGRKDLAARMTQHYLDAYAQGLNQFIRELQEITRSSRETYLRRPE